MKRPTFSIAVMLLVITIAGLVIALFVEKQKRSELENVIAQREAELGHIDVTDPSKIHARALHCEAFGAWQYRLYIPPDSKYVVEFYHHTGALVILDEEPIAPDPGQHTITVQVAEDLRQPNDISVHTFMISFEDRRAGISFLRKDVRNLANGIGNYDNDAHRLEHFLSHNQEVDVVGEGETFELLHLKDTSKTPKMVDGEPAEIIIRLVPTKPRA